MEMKCTKNFLKYAAMGLLISIMLAIFVIGAACALVGMLVPWFLLMEVMFSICC